jgi:integrase
MRLNELACKNAKPSEKAKKLSDGKGLYLEVSTSGAKYWRLKYRHGGKEKRISLGVYPSVTLKQARMKCEAARLQIQNGTDPSLERKIAKTLLILESDDTFKSIAEEWHKKRSGIWTEKHSVKVLKRLKVDIFSQIGSFPINQINPPALLAALRKVEAKGNIYSAHRLLQIVGQIFRYAVASGKAERDITGDLRGALQPAKKANYSRLSENELPEFLDKLAAYEGERQTKIATQLLLLTFVRTNELRAARWSEFDLDRGEWRIPGERMKMRQLHIVPLADVVVKLLRIQKAYTGTYEFVFPNRNRPQTFISENTILYTIYRLGYHNRTTAHGFRGTASTILNEKGLFMPDVIERQLAHGDRNLVRASYNHAQYLDERRRMMQWWADHLQKLCAAAFN